MRFSELSFYFMSFLSAIKPLAEQRVVIYLYGERVFSHGKPTLIKNASQG